MSFTFKPDYEQVKRRYEAFWERGVADRPLVSLTYPAVKRKPLPRKEYACERERWTDIEFRAEAMAAALENTVFYADALPVAWPNMGPEIFSAWCGCPYHFGETTTWTDPCVHDWATDEERSRFDPGHPLYLLMLRFTELLIERGKGRFIVGLTDFHPGGDHLAALRDPAELAVDLIENPDQVKLALERSYPEYFTVYDTFYHMLRAAGMPITSWIPCIHEGRYYIPSNDFSCMISPAMFGEFFLPGLREECRFLERSIYHLDGPGALRHLEAILAIPELDAVQWVPGAGREGFSRWVEIYRRIQNAGKSVMISEPLTITDLPLIFETLRPEGVWIASIRGIPDEETARAVLKSVERWGR